VKTEDCKLDGPLMVVGEPEQDGLKGQHGIKPPIRRVHKNGSVFLALAITVNCHSSLPEPLVQPNTPVDVPMEELEFTSILRLKHHDLSYMGQHEVRIVCRPHQTSDVLEPGDRLSSFRFILGNLEIVFRPISFPSGSVTIPVPCKRSSTFINLLTSLWTLPSEAVNR